MSALGDATPVQRLTIPGTHDSGARIGGPWVACQNTSVDAQLTSGVRFLDVRCRAIDNVFAIHHGAFYQELMFGDVLNACRAFLQAHPSETVLMRVKQEYSEVGAEEFRRIFDLYLDDKGYRSLFRLDAGLPTLGQARGRVVLLADSDGLGGVRYADPQLFDIQDDYMAEPFGKYPKIEAQFRKAVTQPGKLFVNYVSTSALLPPRSNADRLNPAGQESAGGIGGERLDGPGHRPDGLPERVRPGRGADPAHLARPGLSSHSRLPRAAWHAARRGASPRRPPGRSRHRVRPSTGHRAPVHPTGPSGAAFRRRARPALRSARGRSGPSNGGGCAGCSGAVPGCRDLRRLRGMTAPTDRTTARTPASDWVKCLVPVSPPHPTGFRRLMRGGGGGWRRANAGPRRRTAPGRTRTPEWLRSRTASAPVGRPARRRGRAGVPLRATLALGVLTVVVGSTALALGSPSRDPLLAAGDTATGSYLPARADGDQAAAAVLAGPYQERPGPPVTARYGGGTAAPLAASRPLQAAPAAPSPAVGALFSPADDDGEPFHHCTASVVHAPAGDLVVTAAHCVHDGGFRTRLVFAPGLHDGFAPYGLWVPTRIHVDPRWISDRDPDHDVAFLRVAAGPGAAARAAAVSRTSPAPNGSGSTRRPGARHS